MQGRMAALWEKSRGAGLESDKAVMDCSLPEERPPPPRSGLPEEQAFDPHPGAPWWFL